MASPWVSGSPFLLLQGHSHTGLWAPYCSLPSSLIPSATALVPETSHSDVLELGLQQVDLGDTLEAVGDFSVIYVNNVCT